MTDYNPMAVPGHNSGAEAEAGPTKADIFKGIDSLYEEAGHWADGTDIENVQQHDAVTAIREAIHELGKQADELRVAEKAPLDKQVDAIQKEFNPYIQKSKGKVDRAKSCLDSVLARWRIAQQRIKDEEARLKKEKAEEEMRKATAAIRESAGNLLAREDAEQQLEEAKKEQRQASRAHREANTATGLRTVRSIELPEENREEAMDWAFGHDAEAFYRLAVDMAAEHFRATTKVAPGFTLVERKVAR